MRTRVIFAAFTGLVAVVLGFAASEPSTAIAYRMMVLGWASFWFVSRILVMGLFAATQTSDQHEAASPGQAFQADPYPQMPSLV